MRTQKSPDAFGFDRYDRGRLQRILAMVSDKRTFLRLKAVLLVAEGKQISAVAKLFDRSVQMVYRWINRYLKAHRPSDLFDGFRPGRPPAAQAITQERIIETLGQNPLHLGYQITGWTVELLAVHLNSCYGSDITPVLLFQDEIILRLFPVLRRAWSLKGEQARVAISGKNDRQVLFGTINPCTGHRVLMRYPALNQTGFQAFLRLLRHRYPGRSIWLLLDAATAHTTAKSRQQAERLDIELVWLPKQCPELNAMDHLWKELRADISANYQYQDADEHAVFAELYTLSLSNKQALNRAGILSENFWLKSFLN